MIFRWRVAFRLDVHASKISLNFTTSASNLISSNYHYVLVLHFNFAMKLLLYLIALATFPIHLRAQPPSVESIIRQTCEKAGRENKTAFIIFHASWCVWCHRLDSSINDPSCAKFFTDHFVIEHITAFETDQKQKLNNPGWKEFLTAHHLIDQGIPAWFIFDKDGNLLADSQKRPAGTDFDTEGSNIGCPANGQEVDYFIGILKKVALVSAEEEQSIRSRFLKNNAHPE